MKLHLTTKKGAPVDIDITPDAMTATLQHAKLGALEIANPHVSPHPQHGPCLMGRVTAKGKEQPLTAPIRQVDADRVRNAQREAFEAAIPGYHALSELVAKREQEDAAFRAAMERGNGRLPARTVTDDDIDAACRRHPVAAAYRKAEAFARASAYRKSLAGQRAKQRLLAGEDYETVIAEMDNEWSEAASAAVENA